MNWIVLVCDLMQGLGKVRTVKLARVGLASGSISRILHEKLETLLSELLRDLIGFDRSEGGSDEAREQGREGERERGTGGGGARDGNRDR